MRFFTRNKLGKISAIFGCIAFIFSVFSAYSASQYYGYNPVLSPFINTITKPIQKITVRSELEYPATGPSMRPAGIFPIHEEGAILGIFIFASLLGIASIACAFFAARRNEHTIWYANGVFCAGSGMYLFNAYLAIIAVVLAIVVILKVRKRNELFET